VSERSGDWQLMASGRRVWPLDPRPEDIDIGDIAHHLSRICRWNGATRRHYSVAEHSYALALHFRLQGNLELARWALLHDAAEAYTGDIVRPLKRAIDIGHIERRLERVIWPKFGLHGELPREVLRADTAILGDERDQLFEDGGAHAAAKRAGETGIGVALWQLTAPEAKAFFLAEFSRLFLETRS